MVAVRENFPIEVLSPSTEADDRGDKFEMYARNPNLQEYVLVNSNKVAIDLYRKNDRGEWVITNYRSGSNIELDSVNLTFAIETVYDGIVFEPLN